VAAWATGRYFTLQLSGTIDIGRHSKASAGVAPDEGEITVSDGTFSCELYARTSPEIKVKLVVTPGSSGRIKGWKVEVWDGLGGYDSADNYEPPRTPPAWEFDCSISHGSYSISIDCEEWAYVGAIDEVDSYGFPQHPEMDVDDPVWVSSYGTARPDGVPGRVHKTYLKAKVGGYVRVNVSAGGVSASLATVIASTWLMEWQTVWTTYCYATSNRTTQGGYCRTTVDYHDLSINPAYTRSVADATAQAYLQTFSAEVTAPVSAGVASTASCSVIAEPPVIYDLRARVRAWDQAYPDSATIRYTDAIKYRAATAAWEQHTATLVADPENSVIVPQRSYTCGSTLDGTEQTYQSVAEKCGMRAWLDESWFSTSGEDSRDWRCQFRGRLFDSATITRAESTTLDSGASTSGWSGSNGTVASAGGVIVFTPTAASPSLVRAFSPDKISEGYRYLRLRIRSVGVSASALTLALAGQTWNFVTGAAGAWVDVDIDLACATSETDDVEPKDSRFPIEDPGVFPTSNKPTQQYRLGWGVNWIGSLSLSGFTFAGGVSYEIDYLELRKGTDSGLAFIAPFADYTSGWVSASDTTTLNNAFALRADGRVSDWPGLAHIVPFSGAESYRWYTITEGLGFINYVLGWGASDAGSFPDSYHTNGLELGHLAGGGATYNHGSGLWSDWVEKAITSTLDVPAQGLYDLVIGYPQAGRGIWDGSSFDPTRKAIPVVFTKILRGRGEGLVFDTNARVLNGARVLLKREADLTDIRGSVLTDAIGRYLTASPWAKGNRDHRTELDYGSTTHLYSVEKAHNRRRSRVSFRRLRESLKALGYAVSRTMRHARGFAVGGAFHLGFAENVGYAWSDVDTGKTVTSAQLDYAHAGRSDVLRVCLCELGTIYVYEANKETGALALSITVGSGSHGASAGRPDGIVHTYRLLSGTVYTRAYDAQGNALYTEQTTNLTGLDDVEIDAHYSVGQDGQALIGMLYTVGGAITYKTSPDGINFS
jgi:hypothetical protein